jgi:hypothetical protein
MRKASTVVLEQGASNAVPCSRPHPRSKRTTKLIRKLSFGLVQPTGALHLLDPHHSLS